MPLQEIQKLGVGITGDAHKLQRDFGVQCTGLVCLSEEASLRLTKEQMPETRGLAGSPPQTALPKASRWFEPGSRQSYHHRTAVIATPSESGCLVTQPNLQVA